MTPRNGRALRAARRDRRSQASALEPAATAWVPGLWRGRLHAIAVIQRRDLNGILFGPGLYLATALGMIGALVVVRDHLDAIARNRVLVLADAFALPFFVAASIGMIFLALVAVATVAREKDAGTLETLFYGPVDHTSYLLAKHLAQIVAFTLMSLMTAMLLLSYAGLSGLRLGWELVPEVVLSVAAAAGVAALGLLLSTSTRSARGAFILFFGVVALFLFIRLGSVVLSAAPVTNNFSPLLFARDLVLTLDSATGYVSPFGVFEKGVDAIVRGSIVEYLWMLLLALAQCAILLVTSIRLLERRGVRRR